MPKANNAAANSAATEKPKPAYCFFKDLETKAWKAKADKDGNVVVSGKAYREDPRYKALLSPATVSEFDRRGCSNCRPERYRLRIA